METLLTWLNYRLWYEMETLLILTKSHIVIWNGMSINID